MADELYDALYRKAVGYQSEEEVREYGSDDELIKRKVTLKNVPPDTAALKAYLELSPEIRRYASMNREQLIEEAEKIYKTIKEINDNGD